MILLSNLGIPSVPCLITKLVRAFPAEICLYVFPSKTKLRFIFWGLSCGLSRRNPTATRPRRQLDSHMQELPWGCNQVCAVFGRMTGWWVKKGLLLGMMTLTINHNNMFTWYQTQRTALIGSASLLFQPGSPLSLRGSLKEWRSVTSRRIVGMLHSFCWG